MSLPSGYKLLEYIQSTGTQYVDTGFVPNQDTRVYAEAVFSVASKTQNLFGCRVNGSSRQYQFASTNGAYRTDYDTKINYFATFDYGTKKFYIDKNKNVTNLNGEHTSTHTYATFTCPGNMYIFTTNNNGTVYGFATAKLYLMRVYDNGTLVRDFIPCQTTSGEIGLWDDVNSVFYGNAGTGAFTAGPIVVSQSEITELEYIQSSGTQYIDTGFIPNQDTRVEVECALVPSTQDTRFLLGSRSAASLNEFQIATSGGYYRTDYNKTHSNLSNISYGNEKFYIDKDKNVTNLNNEYSATATYSSFSCPVNFYIFGTNSNGSFYNGATAKVYTCKIYDNGTLIRDYIPAKLSDGTVGLYDKLNGLLYINAGTGMFEAGPSSLNFPVNIGGTWKDANEAFVNIGGTWKTVETAFVNIGGTWKELG